jgi:protein-tyrosine phosphatase
VQELQIIMLVNHLTKNHGVDISNQRCRQFTTKYFEEFEFIYVMDKSNYANLIQLATSKKEKQKVKLILIELHPNENIEVPDSYYGVNDSFENVF